MARVARISSHQERHQVGARCVRDPGLIAIDPIDFALAHRARLERHEVGAGVRFSEHCSRQHFAGSDLRKPAPLLLRSAASQDEVRGNFGARAERAYPDVAARELLANDAHSLLAKPEPTVLLRNGEAKDAKRRHSRNDVERDQLIVPVPGLRMRRNLTFGKATYLLADRSERLIEIAV